MNYNEYQKQAKRTCASLGSEKLDLSHMVMGMSSEVPELFDSKGWNTSEELADIMWYLANYCTFRNINMGQFEELKNQGDILYIPHPIGELTDIIKKKIAYDKPIDATLENKILKTLFGQIRSIYEELGINITQSLQNNIDKLKVRYPDKFDTEKAKNRNINQEIKELKK